MYIKFILPMYVEFQYSGSAYLLRTRRVHSVGSNVENSIRFALFVGSDFFDSIGRIVECRIFDIRSALLRMSDFFYSIGRPSNVEYSTSEAPSWDVGFSAFDRPSIECRIYIHCVIVF